jgi:hypothetical protein
VFRARFSHWLLVIYISNNPGQHFCTLRFYCKIGLKSSYLLYPQLGLLKRGFSENMSSNDEFFLHAKHCSIDKRMIHFAAQSVLKWQFVVC